MITLKPVILKHQKKADGTWNVKIRVTCNRNTAYFPTNVFVKSSQVNKKLEITDNFIRVEVDTLITELRRKVVGMGNAAAQMSAKELSGYLKNEMEKGGDLDICILKFGRDLAEKKIKAGGQGTGKLYLTLLNRVEGFLGLNKLPAQDITVRFLKDFQNYLEHQELTDTGINLYMRTLRAIFNAARNEYNDEDRGLIKIPHYPFLKYKIPAATPAKKRALKVETLRAIRNCEPKNPREQLARDVFMLSFYLMGMNTVDLYNCTQIEENRILYQRTKTKTRRRDKAMISVKIEPEARQLVAKYRDKTKKRVFDFHNMYADRSTFNANINKGLKKVGEIKAVNVPGLNTYFARHSWATIARNICGISKDDIALCLNHASQDNRVTDLYIEKDNSIADRANRRVIDCLSSYSVKIEITSPFRLSEN